ncbi:MAG: hypothetical protein Q4D66_07295, partial [Bacteroidales bacterium]|nr:hypothetical protein [Bacteroidales bacterium]
GPRSRDILDKIAVTLQVGHIEELSHKVILTPAEKKNLKQQYRSMIAALLQQRLSELRVNHTSPQERSFKPAAQKAIENIERMENRVVQMQAQGEVDSNVILQADVALKQSYALLRTYADHVNFKNVDRDQYVADPVITQPTRLLSVIDVWKDYLRGYYDGRGFIYWILLSIVVDFGAFLCFGQAFKREE